MKIRWILLCAAILGWSAGSTGIFAGTTNAPIKVLAPLAGETVALGENIGVAWTSDPPFQPVDVKIVNASGEVMPRPMLLNYAPSSANLSSVGFATAASGSLALPLGQYKARVFQAGTTNYSESATFSIIAPVAGVSPIVSAIMPQPVSVGEMLTVHVQSAGRHGNVILQTEDGLKTWINGYASDVRNLGGFLLYDGSTLSFRIPGTIGLGVHPDGWWNEPIVPVTKGRYILWIHALNEKNEFVKSNVVTVRVGSSEPPLSARITAITFNGRLVEITAQATPNRNFLLEQSDDLITWSGNTTVSSSNTGSWFLGLGSPNMPKARFYRLKAQ